MNDNAPTEAREATLLTHRGLADLLGVSETTVKSYRRKFPGCIPVANLGKPIRFTEEATRVCLKIRDLFELGMSVEEVRARLEQEFAWIPPREDDADAKQKSDPSESGTQTPQEVKNILGSLSKAMITLSQQQNTILKKVQRLEENHHSLPHNPQAEGQEAHGAPISHNVDFEDRLAGYEHKLDELSQRFESIPEQLSGMMQKMFEQSAERMLSEVNAHKNASEGGEGQNQHKSAVVPFRKNRESEEAVPDIRSDSRPAIHTDGGQQEQEQPPRRLLTLPLVLRSLSGEYMSAAGKSRGRFCLNDLKALLAYNSPPPGHFMLRWEKDQAGWWFALEQVKAENPRCLRLLLTEMNTQRGEPVALIIRLTDNGNDVHPSELLPFISGLSETK